MFWDYLVSIAVLNASQVLTAFTQKYYDFEIMGFSSYQYRNSRVI